MTTKLIAAAMLALTLSSAAYAGEGNGEPFPLTISINPTTHTSQFSLLPVTSGLPAGALQGTPAYEQAQSASRWYAQQSDHRFAQRAVPAGTNG